MKKLTVYFLTLILTLQSVSVLADIADAPSREWIVKTDENYTYMESYEYKDTFSLLSYLGILKEKAEEIFRLFIIEEFCVIKLA